MSTYPDKDAYGHPRTPYAIHCYGWEKNDPEAHGLVYITEVQYNAQMDRPDSLWACPLCGIKPAGWDDGNFAEMTEEKEEPSCPLTSDVGT